MRVIAPVPAGLRLERMGFWSLQVTLLHNRINEADDFEQLEADALALLIAIAQYRAARGE